ncbi:MAG: hypothetical protein ACI4GO_08415 [Hominenteromicrobium sp.]
MTDSELKRLKRIDLLEMLVAQSRENETLRAQLEQAQEQLQSREIALDRAGSIAEASLQISGVFAAAEQAGAQYLENIERLSGEQAAVCERMERMSREKAAAMLSEAAEKCRVMEQETQEKCVQMLAQAERESQAYWTSLSEKLEQFCAAHEALAELLPSLKEKLAQG